MKSLGASPGLLVVKNPPANAWDVREVRDEGSVPGSGRPPIGGHGSPLLYSCLENPMDGGAWRATVQRVANSQTRLKWLSTAQWKVCRVTKCMILLLLKLKKEEWVRGERQRQRKKNWFPFQPRFSRFPSLISYDPFLVIFTTPSLLSSFKNLQFSSFLFFLFLCLGMPKFENHCSWWEGPSKSFM